MPRFDKTITLGNILTIIALVGAALTLAFGNPGDYIRVEARVTALEKADANAQQRMLEFRRDMQQGFADVRSDLRELRQATGVSWRELPPSPYRRER